jgi:hypothetical protein
MVMRKSISSIILLSAASVSQLNVGAFAEDKETQSISKYH